MADEHISYIGCRVQQAQVDPPIRRPFSVGGWTVEPTLARISRDGREVHLRPRAMEVLVRLAMTAGRLAPKRDLLDAVWEQEHVSEHALTQVIAELRDALGDDARSPTFIENIPRRGYRLIVEVTPIDDAAAPPPATASPFRLQGLERDFPLTHGVNVVGRTEDAAVRIDRTEVSRCHARIVVDGTTATLEDLGSKNGTYLNGRRVEGPTTLSSGDEIGIGRGIERLRFLIEGDPTRTETSV